MPSANFVFPVRYVSEGVAVQSTSRELSPLGIAVRSLAPPQVGARVSMALYLPNTSVPEVAIGRVANAHGASEVQVALAWLLARSPAMLPIPGTSSVEHLEENVAAAGLRLSEEEFTELSAAGP